MLLIIAILIAAITLINEVAHIYLRVKAYTKIKNYCFEHIIFDICSKQLYVGFQIASISNMQKLIAYTEFCANPLYKNRHAIIMHLHSYYCKHDKYLPTSQLYYSKRRLLYYAIKCKFI